MSREALLITGVSSGVGLSLARHLAVRFHIVGIARKLELARSSLADVPGVELHSADLAEPNSISSCIDDIIALHGRILYVINNAGVNIPGNMDSLPESALATSMQVNCLAAVSIMQKVLPGMRAASFGRIVNITSGAPLNCFPGYPAYSASKAALNAITVTAARELQDTNIRINLMSPGPVRSNMAPDAPMDPSVCHPTADYLLGTSPDTPTGRFFWLGREIPLFPDLAGIEWLAGTAPPRFRTIL